MDIKIRKALPEDVPAIVHLLVNEELGNSNENFSDPLPPEYYAAFDAINTDKNSFLMVAELNKQVVGTMELTFTTFLTHRGCKRGLIDGFAAAKATDDQGIGKVLLEWGN